jgi:Archaeal fructose-1,6-bisphosphatase and related enzymes of inositol monophosphatase family
VAIPVAASHLEDGSLTHTSATERLAFDAARDWATVAMRMALDPATGSTGVRKGDPFDIVTPADGAIERYLRSQALHQFPDHAFLGEEEGGANGAHAWQWIVDPIDGTLNYSTGLAGACCSIACVRDGELVVGAIADYSAGLVYRARAGTGTVLVGGPDGETACEPTTSPAGAARVFLEFGWEDLDPVMLGTIEELSRARLRVIRMVGGAAYALLNVALYGGCMLGIGLRIWDVAAGVVLAREAGRDVRLWQAGTLVHLVVGSTDDLSELAPIVERFGASRVAPAVS